MEDAHRLILNLVIGEVLNCLNPCSDGRCSPTLSQQLIEINQYSLNPCSDGRCSQTLADQFGVAGTYLS